MDRREVQTASVPASPARATSNRLCRDLRALARGEGGEVYRHDPDLSFQSHGNGSARPHACSFGSRAFRDVARREGTSPEEAAALLKPAPDDLFEAIEMHPKINDSKHDEPGILEPLQPSPLQGSAVTSRMARPSWPLLPTVWIAVPLTRGSVEASSKKRRIP